ncbi:2Fe-2S iron-sulfur cluster binding domain-containing protein [Alteromonas sp. NFXS44]|uniref:FAD-binding oxidoreductase n=1 Tax=Alteromonas sp. NFXS44 TaxID=2818435 RepID=UPI0032DFBBE1
MAKKPLVISTTRGVTFSQQAGQTLLDASIASQFPVPHSCHSAKCRQCIVTVAEGTTHKFRDENLTPGELASGCILACARTATSDLLIEAGELVHKNIPPVVNIPAMVSAIKRLSSELILVTLQLPMSARFHHLAGQHVAVTNSDGIRRNYSMCDASPQDGHIRILIRKHETGLMSRYWFEYAAQGDLLTLEGPSGRFGENIARYNRPLFIAEKEGIAPLLALKASVNTTGLPLFWLGAGKGEVYNAGSEFDGLAESHIQCFADFSETSMQAMQNTLIKETDCSSVDAVYVCGSAAFLKQIKALLKREPFRGLPVHTEVFIPSGPR